MQGTNKENNQHEYYSDGALDNPDADLLRWDRLTSNILRRIQLTESNNAVVIGLKGCWGSGKTTLLNFIESGLSSEQEGTTIVLKFNPWSTPNADLVTFFFQELERAVIAKNNNTSESNAALAAKIRIFSQYAKLANVLLEPLQKGILFFSGLLLGSGAALSTILSNWVLFGLGVTGILLAVSSRTIASFLSEYAEYLTPRAETKEKTLWIRKQELQKEINKQHLKVVVVIDDIDRLPPKQICETFQLVKNNGDFGRFFYLLAFDENVVREVLSDTYTKQYEGFVDKIVQLSISIPLPEKTVLEKYFVDQIGEIVEIMPSCVIGNWDAVKYTNFMYRYLSHYLNTFREAKRILNAVSQNLPLMIKDDVIEVNPVEFVTLEFLRVRFPNVWEFIRTNRELFIYETNTLVFFGATEEELQVLEGRFKVFIETIEEKYRARLAELLGELFPRTLTLSQVPYGEDSSEEELILNLRVAAPEIFDRYFIYGNYDQDISNLFIENIILEIGRGNGIEATESMHGKQDLVRLLKRLLLTLKKDSVPKLTANSFVSFCFDISDYLPKDTGHAAEYPIRIVLYNLIREALLDYDSRQRFYILEGITSQSRGLFGPIVFYKILEEELKEKKPGQPFIEESSLDTLWRGLMILVRNWHENPELLQNVHIKTILRVLRSKMNPHSFDNALTHLISQDENFKMFLTAYLIREETTQYGNIAGKVKHKYDFESLDKIIDVNEVWRRVEQTTIMEQDSEQEKIAIQTFKDNVQAYLLKRGDRDDTDLP